MIEESILQQKSRTKWLKLGDSNSEYFYAFLKNKISQINIKSLVNQAGTLLQTEHEVQKEVVRFYREFLGKAAKQMPVINLDIMKEGPMFTIEQQLILIKPVTIEEIYTTVSNINDNKAPRCDGFNTFFFKKAWPIIGEDVINETKQLFATTDIYKPINCTSMTLIPKVKIPSSVKEYKPISCCTVMYKIISKVLISRLKMAMASLIDNCQAAFVPGRIISYNIILSHELVKGYGRKGITPRCTIKLDMQKDYDSLEWYFLEQILINLKFPICFVKRIMKCITIVSYFVMINGRPTRPFPAKRG